MPLRVVLRALLAMSILSLVSATAHAAGCLYPGVTVQGPIRGTIQSARYAAMGAWERKISRSRGRRYGVWNQAGDQIVDCSWNDRGNRIRCRATAAACSF